MKDFFKTKRFKVLVAIFCLLVGLSIGAARLGVLSQITDQIALTIVAPLKQVSSTIAGNATRFFEQFTKASAYYEENQELKKENRQMKENQVELENLRQENERLRVAAGMREKHVDISYEPATVIGRDPLDQFGSFSINMGSIDGVQRGDPVITEDGLIGWVEKVDIWESTVYTILKPNVKVGVYSTQSLTYGIVSGEMNADGVVESKMTEIDLGSTIAPGDIVTTAGSGRFPREIVVGTVKSLERAPSGLSQVALVEPAVNILQVKEVFVITGFEGQITENSPGVTPQLPSEAPPSEAPPSESSSAISSESSVFVEPPVSSLPPSSSPYDSTTSNPPETSSVPNRIIRGGEGPSSSWPDDVW